MTHYDVHGVSVPALGLGTWQITGDMAREAVEHALSLGYRHVDTAQIYENEAEVGDGLRASGVSRADVFLTTKVWTSNMGAGRLASSVDESLAKLQTDYVDLLLLHWPNDDVDFEDTLARLDGVRRAGKARLVGVSNYPAGMLRRALDVVPELATDQVEYHPFLDQSALLGVVRERGMVLTAYSPLAQGDVPADEMLAAIGEAHGASAAQVALAWLLEQDRVVAIPKASSAAHREGNLGALDLALSDDDRARIAALPKGRRLADPDFAPDWDA